MDGERLDLEPIKERLRRAGYPHPSSETPPSPIRDVSPAAQAARAELREHVIDDIWALIDALEALRERT